MKHWAIIGRVSGDTEDTCLIYSNCSRGVALERFTRAILMPDDNPDDVIVTCILSSTSPFTVED